VRFRAASAVGTLSTTDLVVFEVAVLLLPSVGSSYCVWSFHLLAGERVTVTVVQLSEALGAVGENIGTNSRVCTYTDCCQGGYSWNLIVYYSYSLC
jgi:hypothetical protein